MRDSCLSCRFLDKTRCKPSPSGTAHVLYGCKARGEDGYVCGWADGDKDLKWQGCSYFENHTKNEQITFFK